MTKQKEPDRPGEPMLNELHKNDKNRNKEKRTTKMEKILKSRTFTAIVTVFIMAALAAGAYFIHQNGIETGRDMQRNINAEIQSQVKVLSANMQVEASK